MAQAALLAQRGQAKPATETYTDILHRLPISRLHRNALPRCMRKTHPQSLPRTTSPQKRARHYRTIQSYAELLGRLSYEKKEYPRAVQLFQESARKRPLDANSLFYLGMSQLQARQTAEARGALNQALAGGLQEPLAAEAKQALADLQRE